MERPRKPDIVILDRESRRKCSIYPLRQRSDLLFFESHLHAQQAQETFSPDYLLLHVDGTPLGTQDAWSPLVIVDSSWRRASLLSSLPLLQRLPKRSLSGFVTAYPRVSKVYEMPEIGLASIEALYLAQLIQGREDDQLLAFYHWREQFLAANAAAILPWRQLWQSYGQ
jgi:pre-rRNA-processing protein TSR3